MALTRGTSHLLNVFLCVGGIGDVRHMEVSFGLDVQLVPRISRRDMGGGASLDLGVYAINLIRLVFDKEQPLEIIAKGELYSSGE